MPIPKEIEQFIAESGNNFHAKVARWLQEQGWHVTISPYYMDQSQQKAREIDLIAEKAWPIKDYFGNHHGDVLVRLFLECKFVSSPSAFWFAPKDESAAAQLVCSTGVFRTDNTYTSKHHYLSSCKRVAKLFASKASKNQETEQFYKALNQVLNAFVSMRGQQPAIESLRTRRRGKLVTLEFPVVVCSSFEQLFAVDFLGVEESSQINENFQLEVQYAYMSRGGSQSNDYFLLDFVDYTRLSGFVSAIQKNAESAAHLSGPD